MGPSPERPSPTLIRLSTADTGGAVCLLRAGIFCDAASRAAVFVVSARGMGPRYEYGCRCRYGVGYYFALFVSGSWNVGNPFGLFGTKRNVVFFEFANDCSVWMYSY